MNKYQLAKVLGGLLAVQGLVVAKVIFDLAGRNEVLDSQIGFLVKFANRAIEGTLTENEIQTLSDLGMLHIQP